MYLPARAYNAYQHWRDDDPEATVRDLGFAATLGLDAMRVFLSYECWQERPAAHGDALDERRELPAWAR